MTEILRKLLALAMEGRLEVEGVTLGNPYDIELGDAEHFEGEIKFRVKYEGGVIDLGNELTKVME